MQPVPTPEKHRSTHEYSSLAKPLKVLIAALLAYASVALMVLLIEIHQRSFATGLDFEQLLPGDSAKVWLYPPTVLLLVITAMMFITWPRATCQCSGCTTTTD